MSDANRVLPGVADLPPRAQCFFRKKGFAKLTPVQQYVIPWFGSKRRDVAVEACTGSGKTLAYWIPTVERIFADNFGREQLRRGVLHVGAICVAPTRELAVQVADTLNALLACYEEAEAAEPPPEEAKQPEGRRKTMRKSRSPPQKSSSQRSAKAVYSLCLVSSAVAKNDALAAAHIAKCLETSNKAAENEGRETVWILTSTPGRLDAMFTNHPEVVDSVYLNNLSTLILDEADRLVDAGASFAVQLSSIVGRLPRGRVTGVFSATLTYALAELVRAGLRNPVHIRIDQGGQVSVSDSTSTNLLTAADEEDGKAPDERSGTARVSSPIKQAAPVAKVTALPSSLHNYYVAVKRGARQAYLLKFLLAEVFSPRRGGGRKAILFCLTCAHVRYMYELLRSLQKRGCSGRRLTDVVIEKLCGQMPQTARLAALERFKQPTAPRGSLLLATDVAARGLDIPDTDWIIQYEAPQDPAAYVHRVGRTARAGKVGRTLLLLDYNEAAYLPFLEARKIVLKDLEKSSDKTIAAQMKATNLTSVLRYPRFPMNHPNYAVVAQDSTVVAKIGALDEFPYEKQENVADDPDTNSLIAVTRLPVEEWKRAWEVFRLLLVIDHTLLDLQTAALVSLIRAYKEHQLQFVFPFGELQIADMAFSCGALRLPRIKEIVGHDAGFVQSSIDPDDIPWLGKDSEAILARRKEKRAAELAKREERQKALQAKRGKAPKLTQHQRKKRRELSAAAEAAETAEEERAARRLKKRARH